MTTTAPARTSGTSAKTTAAARVGQVVTVLAGLYLRDQRVQDLVAGRR